MEISFNDQIIEFLENSINNLFLLTGKNRKLETKNNWFVIKDFSYQGYVYRLGSEGLGLSSSYIIEYERKEDEKLDFKYVRHAFSSCDSFDAEKNQFKLFDAINEIIFKGDAEAIVIESYNKQLNDLYKKDKTDLKKKLKTIAYYEKYLVLNQNNNDQCSKVNAEKENYYLKETNKLLKELGIVDQLIKIYGHCPDCKYWDTKGNKNIEEFSRFPCSRTKKFTLTNAYNWCPYFWPTDDKIEYYREKYNCY